MKGCFLLIIFFIYTGCYAQKYRAIYRYNFKIDEKAIKVNFMSPDLDSAKIGYDFKSSIVSNNTAKDDSIVKKYFSEQRKVSYNESVSIICICTPQLLKKLYSFANITTNQPGSIFIKKYFMTNEVTSFFDCSSYIKTVIKETPATGEKKKICWKIDTAKLHFYYTGKKEIINKWKSKEVKSKLENYKDVSIWVTKDLPGYINPLLPMLDAEGAIVKIVFGKGDAIILYEVTKTDEPFGNNVMCNNTDSLRISDVLAFPERQW